MEYFVRQTLKPNIYEVSKFEGKKDSDGVYYVKYTPKIKYCSCYGWHRQRDKSQHKHIKLTDFWINFLDKEPGYVFWYEGEDLEYRKVFDIESIQNYIKENL